MPAGAIGFPGRSSERAGPGSRPWSSAADGAAALRDQPAGRGGIWMARRPTSAGCPFTACSLVIEVIPEPGRTPHPAFLQHQPLGAPEPQREVACHSDVRLPGCASAWGPVCGSIVNPSSAKHLRLRRRCGWDGEVGAASTQSRGSSRVFEPTESLGLTGSSVPSAQMYGSTLAASSRGWPGRRRAVPRTAPTAPRSAGPSRPRAESPPR
jgi:hypothetical protein